MRTVNGAKLIWNYSFYAQFDNILAVQVVTILGLVSDHFKGEATSEQAFFKRSLWMVCMRYLPVLNNWGKYCSMNQWERDMPDNHLPGNHQEWEFDHEKDRIDLAKFGIGWPRNLPGRVRRVSTKSWLRWTMSQRTLGWTISLTSLTWKKNTEMGRS